MIEKFQGKGMYLIILASVFFSLMGAGVKYVSARIPFQEIVFFRALTGTVIILIITLLRKRPIWGREKSVLVMRGLFGFCAISCFFFALSTIPLADAVLLSYTSPIFVAILSIFFLHERISLNLGIFILIAFTTIFVILQPTLDIINIGGIAGIGSGFFASLSFIWIKKLRRESSLSIIFYFAFITSLLSLPFALISFVRPTYTELIILIINGIVATIAQLALTIAILIEKVSVASALTCLAVVFSYLIGLVFWGETLELSSIIAGIILITSSILFSRKNLSKKL